MIDDELKVCCKLMKKLKMNCRNNKFNDAESIRDNIKLRLLKQIEMLDELELIRYECNIDEDADISLKKVNLSSSLKNSLFRNGYTTIHDLYNEDMDILKDYKTIGSMRLEEIQQFKDWVNGKNKLFYIKNI